MTEIKTARRVILPRHVETRMCDDGEPDAIKTDLKNGSHYSRRPLHLESAPGDKEGLLSSTNGTFIKYPIILCSDDAPWHEANIWMRLKLRDLTAASKSTRNIATTIDDLVAYRRFVEDEGIDWMDFSSLFKEARPTYRFQTYLSDQVLERKISYGVGKRRLGTIVRFYRWLIDSAQFEPLHPVWHNKEITLPIQTRQGAIMEIRKSVPLIDMKGKPKPNPFDQTISDGGKLHPLSKQEQSWLLEALFQHGNYELQLMHLLSISTSARLQTVLTLRRKHFWKGLEPNCRWGTVSLRSTRESLTAFTPIPVGPGTGADTKFDQTYHIYVPRWLYEKLHTYVHCERATKRRERAYGGDVDEQYVFLTKRNQPWYVSKQSPFSFAGANLRRRSHIAGGAVGTLIRENIIPYVKAHFDPNFRYSFHDLRATFGMNEIDRLLDKPIDHSKPGGRKWTLTEVLQWVMARMNHSRITTTENYVKYRDNLRLIRALQDAWEDDLTDKMKKHADSFEKNYLNENGENLR